MSYDKRFFQDVLYVVSTGDAPDTHILTIKDASSDKTIIRWPSKHLFNELFVCPKKLVVDAYNGRPDALRDYLSAYRKNPLKFYREQQEDMAGPVDSQCELKETRDCTNGWGEGLPPAVLMAALVKETPYTVYVRKLVEILLNPPTSSTMPKSVFIPGALNNNVQFFLQQYVGLITGLTVYKAKMYTRFRCCVSSRHEDAKDFLQLLQDTDSKGRNYRYIQKTCRSVVSTLAKYPVKVYKQKLREALQGNIDYAFYTEVLCPAFGTKKRIRHMLSKGIIEYKGKKK